MTEEFVVVVDKNDNPIGLEEKVKCHLPNGKLHRAFTTLLFDKTARLLLTKRSQSKMLWPGGWDGTVASHSRESETYAAAGERRLSEEIGVSCKLEYLFKFEYHVPYKDIGSENEICGTLIGILDNPSNVKPIKEEISEMNWVTREEILGQLRSRPQIYCPWMVLALYLLPVSEKKLLPKHKTVLETWIKSEVKHGLQEPVKFHFPDDRWELKKC
ncbi:MAG: isopentenyl-diphosphate Delta-isomerase [Nitrosopumilaceae archaeon]